MENRPLRLVAGLIGTLAAALALAQEPAAADRETRLKAAKAQQKEGKARKAAARSLYQSEKKACFERFRVTDCQQDALRRYVAATTEARRIENKGLEQERQVRREKLADKDARRAADAPQREADLVEREADVAAEQQRIADKQAKSATRKEARAEKAEQRQEREQEKRRKKQEKHDKQVAQKLEKAARREAHAPSAPATPSPAPESR